MTQKEWLLQKLIGERSGLTSVELRERTGIPDASLRTILWEMRRDGWIEPVGGVRGRYRYGITREGRRQAPTPPIDPVAEALWRGLGVRPLRSFPPDAGWPRPNEPRRELLDFVRWLAKTRSDLLAADDPDIVLRLEEAAADYIYQSGGEDVIKLLLGRGGLGQEHDDR